MEECSAPAATQAIYLTHTTCVWNISSATSHCFPLAGRIYQLYANSGKNWQYSKDISSKLTPLYCIIGKLYSACDYFLLTKINYLFYSATCCSHLKKLKTILMEYSGAWRKLIHEKTWSRKSYGTVSLMGTMKRTSFGSFCKWAVLLIISLSSNCIKFIVCGSINKITQRKAGKYLLISLCFCSTDEFYI